MVCKGSQFAQHCLNPNFQECPTLMGMRVKVFHDLVPCYVYTNDFVNQIPYYT